MHSSGPPPSPPMRKSVGGPVLFRKRRHTIGWAALFFSIAAHGLVAGIAVWFWIGGQGNEGDLGMDQQDADAATPAFRAIAKAEPQSETVHIKPAQNFKPVRSPILLAATNDAALTMPKWDMQPTKPITAPPPPTPPVAQTAPPKASPPQPSAQASKPAARPQRRAPGSGAGGGMGNNARSGDQPRVVSSSPPYYPPSARRDGAQGTAFVKVSLSSNGRVADCSIYRSTGNAALDGAALKTVRTWRFTPTSDGTEVLVTVSFKLT